MGFRGYVSSREFFGERAPQHVQNIVIRHYCERNNMDYLLSSTEVAMPGMYLMLNQLVAELGKIDGIVCYSLFQLPVEFEKRQIIFDQIIDAGKTMHFAVEMLQLTSRKDASKLNEVVSIKKTIESFPLGNELKNFANLVQ